MDTDLLHCRGPNGGRGRPIYKQFRLDIGDHYGKTIQDMLSNHLSYLDLPLGIKNMSSIIMKLNTISTFSWVGQDIYIIL